MFTGCILVVSVLGYVQAYPNGAPCGVLTPNHPGTNGGMPQNYELIFNPPLVNGEATPGKTYEVTLNSVANMGFALKVDGGSLQDGSGCGKFPCGDAMFLTHAQAKCPLKAYWKAPFRPTRYGPVTFRYTVVKKFSEYSVDNQMQVGIEPWMDVFIGSPVTDKPKVGGV